MFRFVAAFVLLCWAWPALAQQAAFEKSPTGGWTEFRYRYADYNRQPQDLRFMLQSRALNQGVRQFGGLDRRGLQNHVVAGLRDFAASLPQVEVTVDAVGDTIAYAARGQSDAAVQDALAQLQSRSDDLENEYLARYYFVKDTTGKYVMPDHLRIARDYVAPLRSVGRALAEQSGARTQRQMIDTVLNFVQSIPYDTLEDRTTSNGAGFVTPFGLLAGNRGDCDSKSVLMLALLRGLYPQLPLIMVYTHEHAFVGIKTEAQSGDRIIRIQNRVYVLAEPAGPGLLPLGQLGHESRADLDRDYFSHIAMP
jgi:hypothetical protein